MRAISFLLLFTSTLFADQLSNSIFQQYEAGEYAEAASLLQNLKQQDPDRYAALPFALLHAKVLLLAGDKKAAFDLYKNLSGDSRFAPFTLLSVARMSASEGDFPNAIRYYQSYLSHGRYPDTMPLPGRR